MSAFYHPCSRPNGFLQAQFDLHLEEKSLDLLFFCSANYLGSTRNTLSSLRHVPLWHNILLLKDKNEGCVGALIQHLFKQMKSQWKF